MSENKFINLDLSLYKRRDENNNPSVHDIMRAIEAQLPRGEQEYAWPIEVYPTKYPDGEVIISRSVKGTGERYYKHSYQYNEGNVILSSDPVEVVLSYTVKKTEKFLDLKLRDDNGPN
jgi:hypothetical protein